MIAVKIAMRRNACGSNNPKDIAGIFIKNERGILSCYDIAKLHDMLIDEPETVIYVNNSSSYLIPTRAFNGQKYIRSTPSRDMVDELMRLPRC